jgi:hypothetical protein
MKVGEYLLNASGQLNDQATGREYTRWTRARLLSYFNGALAEIFTYKPEVFATEVTLTLAAGHRQITAIGQHLVSINKNTNGKMVSEADLDLLRAFAPHDCCAGVVMFDAQGNPTYAAKSYAIDPKEPRAFYVSPPVPTGLTPTVQATVNQQPAAYTLADINVDVPIVNKYQENILDYMQGRAHFIDMESPMARQLANTHFTMFYGALGVKYKIQSAYASGNYNGQVGDGDPRARV